MISFGRLQALSVYRLRPIEDDKISNAVLLLAGIENNAPVGANDSARLYAAYRGNDLIAYVDYDAVGRFYD